MLVLSRKLGEAILVQTPDGKSVRIVVTSIKKGSIQLAFDAPRNFPIYREELIEEVKT